MTFKTVELVIYDNIYDFICDWNKNMGIYIEFVGNEMPPFLGISFTLASLWELRKVAMDSKNLKG